MKPDYICVNHPSQEAVSFCHHCHEWLCSACVTEGPTHYYCRRRECLEALEREGALAEGKCPFCGKSIIPGAPRCGACGKELRELTDEEKTEDLVTIASYFSPMEAHLVRSKLESEGIESYVVDEHIVSINSAIAFGGVKVQVKKSDSERAVGTLRLAEGLESPDEIGDSLMSIVMACCLQCHVENEMKENIKFCGYCGNCLII